MEETGARAGGGDRRRVSLSPAKALLHVSVLREDGDPEVGMRWMEETGARRGVATAAACLSRRPWLFFMCPFYHE